MHTVKCRMYEKRLQPRRTRMDIPGWAGKPEPRRDGSHEHAWHCVPFSESAKYGMELLYPFEEELRVCWRHRQPSRPAEGQDGTASTLSVST